MSSISTTGYFGQLSAGIHLFRVSLRRLARSRQTIVCVMLLGLASVAVLAWSLHENRSAEEFIEQIFLAVFVTFLLPIFCLSYATAGIASDREEKTLVYLLVSPMPRPMIFLAKYAASLLLALAWTVGGLSVLCWLAGKAGIDALLVLWPGIMWSTVAYVSLFLVFSVLFRRATIVALAYALFLETLIGNMPGIAERLAISYYTKCLIYDAGSVFNANPFGPRDAELAAIPGVTAQTTLMILSGILLVGGMLIFVQREYARSS
jgi:ABC-type transport system involved in multi-copper enzyme maturation permease subunit